MGGGCGAWLGCWGGAKARCGLRRWVGYRGVCRVSQRPAKGTEGSTPEAGLPGPGQRGRGGGGFGGWCPQWQRLDGCGVVDGGACLRGGGCFLSGGCNGLLAALGSDRMADPGMGATDNRPARVVCAGQSGDR